jgi:FAD/FMN-containing dehydrogenase
MVPAAALGMDIVNGKGELIHLDKDEKNDTWLAATTSLGLLGVIARVQFAIVPDYTVRANQ